MLTHTRGWGVGVEGIPRYSTKNSICILGGDKLPCEKEFPVVVLDSLLQHGKLLVGHRPVADPQLPQLLTLQQPSDCTGSQRNATRNLKGLVWCQIIVKNDLSNCKIIFKV